MTTTDRGGYESWTTEALQEQSERLYDEYLAGADALTELHEIAEILREREKTK